MPTTSFGVTFIKRRIGEYSRSDILDMMSLIQQEVYSVNCAQTEKIDAATGMPPYLATTAGTYVYDCPSDCREVKAVFTDEPTSTYLRNRPTSPFKEYYFKYKGYRRIGVSTISATPNVETQVKFHADPGTTTTTYYLHYYILAPELTAESQNLVLPAHLHRMFYTAVIAAFNEAKYGASGKEDMVIERYATKIRNHLSRGAQAYLSKTPIPEQYMDAAYGGGREYWF